MEASEIYHPATHDRLTEVFFIEPGWGLGLFLKQFFKIPPCIIFWAKIKYQDRQTEDHTCQKKTKTKLWQTQKLNKLERQRV